MWEEVHNKISREKLNWKIYKENWSEIKTQMKKVIEVNKN